MAKIKLAKSAVDAAQPQAQPVELRDTLVSGFLCKTTPAGRKVFMLQYSTNAGERRKPALGLYGELTVEQARSLAQEWLAEVRRGGDPGAAKTDARKAPTVTELCEKFMADYSKQRNKPSTQKGYQAVINRNVIPLLGHKKVHDVKRPDIAALMQKLSYKKTEANKVFSVLRKMFNLAELCRCALSSTGILCCDRTNRFSLCVGDRDELVAQKITAWAAPQDRKRQADLRLPSQPQSRPRPLCGVA